MKVLFYVEPWIEKNQPAWKSGWISAVLLDMAHALNHIGGHSVFFLMGDAQDEMEYHLHLASAATSLITQQELRQIHPDYLQASLEWHQGTYKPETLAAMQALVSKKLNGFTPDIIISFIAGVPFLRALFPEALTLVMESCIFAHGAKPYPANWYLDPCGAFQNSFLRKHALEAAGSALSDEGREFLARLRERYLEQIIKRKTPYTRAQLIDGKPLEHLVLLPLQQAQYFLFNGCCRYRSPWDLVCDVLDRVDPRVGVVLTEHVHWHSDSITQPDALAYLRRRYPNFIYREDFDTWQNVSHLLLPHVDAVAAVSSSVGLNALLWQKPLVALGDSQLNSVADLTDIAQLKSFLDAGQYRNKDAFLYWMLTHYAYMGTRDYLLSAPWLDRQLRLMLDEWRTRGVTKDFYAAPYDAPERILQAYLDAADDVIPLPFSPQNEKPRESDAAKIWGAGKLIRYIARPGKLLARLKKRRGQPLPRTRQNV